MSGAKFTLFILIFFFFWGTSLNSIPIIQATVHTGIANNPPWIQEEEKDIVLKAMLANFFILSSFLNEVEVKQGYLLLRQAKNREEAINYLSQAFSNDLAIAIVDEYTWYIPELNCLAIKAGEGVPILTHEDIPYLNWKPIAKDCIVFSRNFSDCYSPGDIYCYQVEMRLYESKWKISGLSLIELN